MRDELPEIRRRGAELFVIGSGTPEQAKFFRQDVGIDAPVFSDDAKRSFQVAGWKYGRLYNVHPRSALHLLRALKNGSRQSRLQGDDAQQGGVMVIAKGGDVRFAFASKQAGDHPPFRDVLRALRPD